MKNLIIAICVSLLSATTAIHFYDRPKDESLFVHSVYFWLKDDVTAEQHNEFIELLRGLEQIKSVEALEVGQPAGTPRNVVDNSYDVALLVYFEDRAGHDLDADGRGVRSCPPGSGVARSKARRKRGALLHTAGCRHDYSRAAYLSSGADMRP